MFILDMAHVNGKMKFSLDMLKDGSKGIYLQCVSSSTGKIFIINHDRIKILNIRQKKPKQAKRKRQHAFDGEGVSKENREECYICRKGDNGLLMIQCDACDEWDQGDSVGISSEQADLLKEYLCPQCLTKLQWPKLFSIIMNSYLPAYSFFSNTVT